MTPHVVTLPERFGLLGLGVGAAAVAWPAVQDATGASIPCPLRSLTGIPCPFCGMTTASVAFVRGDVATAVAANPGVLLLVAVTVVMTAMVVLRAAGRVPRPRPPSEGRRRLTTPVLVLAALASEAWQVHRLS